MCALVSFACCRKAIFSLLFACLALGSSATAQKPPSGRSVQVPDGKAQSGPVQLTVSVRDERGTPLLGFASVHLFSAVMSYNVTSMTQEASSAVFRNVPPGEYQIEARCDGYKTSTDHVTVDGLGADLSVYVYLHPESESSPLNQAPGGLVMTPKLLAMIDKGLDAMRKQQCEAAKTQFEKAVTMAPANPDVIYLLGTSELCLQHLHLAQKDFEQALNLNPSYEKALLALGEIQLRSGNTSAAIAVLEKAFELNGAGWRTHLLLATAYARAGRLAEAEAHASRAASLAGDEDATARLLLANIQDAEKRQSDARKSSPPLATSTPDTVAPGATPAQLIPAQNVQSISGDPGTSSPLPLSQVDLLRPAPDPAWAPPDIDSKEYLIAPGVSCTTEEILGRALLRLQTQLENFEKFTATERIEHQEIDRHGAPGEIRSHTFSYVVFVKPYKGDSFYLEESRDGGENLSSFPTSLATIGLNGLGVSLLQPAKQDDFLFRCEGLSSVRGEAAWQLRFEEKKSHSTNIRQWKKNGTTYKLPLKGRFWIAATSYDLLRVETDLIEPVARLELTRDHLRVDYGPVRFTRGSEMLWLPLSAEMYMELHNKRFHHQHYLSDYLLFEVDTANKIAKPKAEPAPASLMSP